MTDQVARAAVTLFQRHLAIQRTGGCDLGSRLLLSLDQAGRLFQKPLVDTVASLLEVLSIQVQFKVEVLCNKAPIHVGKHTSGHIGAEGHLSEKDARLGIVTIRKHTVGKANEGRNESGK